MSSGVSGFRPGEPIDDIHLGNVRDDAQLEAARADKDRDSSLSREEMYVAEANRQPEGTTLPRYATWRPNVPVEHDVRPAAPDAASPTAVGGGRFGTAPAPASGGTQPMGLLSASDLLRRSEWLGDFHIDGMGYGNVRFARTNLLDGQRDFSSIYVDLGGFDSGMLLDKDTKIRVCIAPRDFMPDSSPLPLPDVVYLPCDITVQPSAVGRFGMIPGFKAATVTVDTAKLRELSEGSDKLGFYLEIEAKGHGKRYANLDGVPFRNFIIDRSKIE